MKKAKIIAAVAALGASLVAQAAYEVTIPAPNGIGDVITLTNKIAEFNAVASAESGKIWLEPGVYNLSGIYMTSKSHLDISYTGNQSLLFAGKGSDRSKTVLLGGGSAELHRVISTGGSGNYGWTTFSNMTVSGGYVEGEGGGGIKANHSTRYIDMIISNNCTTTSGGGCYGGQAYQCLFADNHAGASSSSVGGAGGAFYAADNSGKCGQKSLQVSGAWDCVFTNNTGLGNSGGGALHLRGVCQRCTFYGNSVNGTGGGGVKVVESFVDATGGKVNVLVSDCTFVGNTGRYGGAVHGTGCIVSNCTFIANKEDCTWASDGGGALCASSAATILDCVFEGNGGTYSPGGAIRLKAGGVISGCSFTTNSTPSSGGAIYATAGAAIVDCAFTNNVATNYGGALYIPGGVTNCTFAGNSSLKGGGAIYSPSQSDADFVGCLFVSNHLSATTWAHGGAVRGVDGVRPKMRSCTFTGNDSPYGYGAAAYYSDLYDCIVTNHVSEYYILYGCNMTGCMLGYNTASGNGITIDYADASVTCTNINCLVISNSHPAIGHITVNKVNINCTYIRNVIGNGNYGDIIRKSPSYNCIYAGNKVGAGYKDIKTWYQDGNTYPLALTNCLYNVSDQAEDYEGLYNCKQVADMKFADEANGDYTPKYRSPAYNAGCQEPWLLELAGAKDLAGNTRVFGDGIDIGAYECQRFPPGAVFTVR